MTVQELSRYLTLRKQIDEDKEIYENIVPEDGASIPVTVRNAPYSRCS